MGACVSHNINFLKIRMQGQPNYIAENHKLVTSIQEFTHRFSEKQTELEMLRSKQISVAHPISMTSRKKCCMEQKTNKQKSRENYIHDIYKSEKCIAITSSTYAPTQGTGLENSSLKMIFQVSN